MLDKLLRYVNALTTGLLIITLTFMTISGYIAMNQILVNQLKIIENEKILTEKVEAYIPSVIKLLEDDQTVFKQMDGIVETNKRIEELWKKHVDGK